MGARRTRAPIPSRYSALDGDRRRVVVARVGTVDEGADDLAAVDEDELVHDQRDDGEVLGYGLSVQVAPSLLASGLIRDEVGGIDPLVEVGVVEVAVVLTRATSSD